MSELTPKQEGFVKDYLDTGNATEAAERNYDIKTEGKTEEQVENTAASIGSQNLRKIKIQQKIQDAVEDAISRIVELSISAENETVRLNANKDIADRGGFKPVEAIELNDKRVLLDE